MNWFAKHFSARTRSQESPGYAHHLLEASLDLLVTVSSEGRVTDANAAAARITGIPRERLVEAAKAGDQGKGFAVVAQEVKNLAEQSKLATTQVRTILGDIQKATNRAAMATEQGSKTVTAGVRQSAEAGPSIQQLAYSVTTAAQAAIQQQVVSMDQLAQAMESIVQAAAQNAARTRKAEDAAQKLHELGQQLSAMIEDKVG